MGRPSDWSLLGGHDPAPGDADAVADSSRRWGVNAAVLEGAQSLLRNVSVKGAGATITAMRTQLDEEAAWIGVYAAVCDKNCDVLSTWRGQLVVHQLEAESLRRQAELADDDRRAGQSLATVSELWLISFALEVVVSPGTKDLEAKMNHGAADKLRGQRIADDANAVLDGLVRQANELRELHKTQGAAAVAGFQSVPSATDAAQSVGLALKGVAIASSFKDLLSGAKDPQIKKLQELRGRVGVGADGARDEYFKLLATMSPAQLVLYQRGNRDDARNPLTVKTPEDVAGAKAWWAGLNQDQRTLLIAIVPGVIGNLNGVPYKDRAQANKTNMDAIYNDKSTSAGTKAAIQSIYDTMKNPGKDDSWVARSVVSFDPNGAKPLAAIAIGDLDVARHVSWNVPGMDNTVEKSMHAWTDASQKLYDGQLDALTGDEVSEGVAMVSWVGYDTPDPYPGSHEVYQPGKARIGAEKLAVALDGFHDTRTPSGPHDTVSVNVVAHSYGTTTTAYALTQTRYDVATVTFAASAGVDPWVVPTAAAMNVDSGGDGKPAVYVTQAKNDFIAPTGINGSQFGEFQSNDGSGRASPSDPSFGAHSFSSEGGYDPSTGQAHKATDGHDALGPSGKKEPSSLSASEGHGYYDTGTESLDSIALSSTGHGDHIKTLVPLKKDVLSYGTPYSPPLVTTDENDQDPATLAPPKD